jgi:hypothetical protein
MTESPPLQDLIVPGYRLWFCKATETGWGPWYLAVSCHRDGTPRKNQVLSQAETHSIARARRKHWPDELIAVRPFWAGPPRPTAKRRPGR